MDVTSSEEVDVVIIGGGISGLVAARYLARNNIKVVILEAQQHVGGRCSTTWIHQGHDTREACTFPVELGTCFLPTELKPLVVHLNAKELGSKKREYSHPAKQQVIALGHQPQPNGQQLLALKVSKHGVSASKQHETTREGPKWFHQVAFFNAGKRVKREYELCAYLLMQRILAWCTKQMKQGSLVESFQDAEKSRRFAIKSTEQALIHGYARYLSLLCGGASKLQGFSRLNLACNSRLSNLQCGGYVLENGLSHWVQSMSKGLDVRCAHAVQAIHYAAESQGYSMRSKSAKMEPASYPIKLTVLQSPGGIMGRKRKRKLELHEDVTQTMIFRCKKVICTSSIGVLQQSIIQFSPPLPEDKAEVVTHRFRMGHLQQVWLLFEEMLPTHVSRFFVVEASSVADQPGSISWPGRYPQHVLDPSLVVRFGSSLTNLERQIETRELPFGDEVAFVSFQDLYGIPLWMASLYWLGPRDEAECLEYVTSKLGSVFGLGQLPGVKEYFLRNWSTAPYIYGSQCFLSTEATGCEHTVLSAPCYDNRLLFAGEATSQMHCGSVLGAIIAGIREAKRIVHGTCWSERKILDELLADEKAMIELLGS